MTPSKNLFLLVLAACACAAQPPKSRDPQKAMADAIARQQASVASMEASLAVQRASLAGSSQSTGGSFFLLPPPTPSAQTSIILPEGNGSGNCDRVPTDQMDAIIEGAARETDIHPDLLRGIIKQESGFSPCAVSSKGAMGLMQLMPATATQFGVKDPFNPKENVDAGAKFFKQLLEFFASVPLALGAYNAGPATVTQAGGIPNYPETQSFIKSILSGLPASALQPKR